MELFQKNLSADDFQQVKAIRTFIDLKNVRQLLASEPLDLRGNLTEKELDEALVNQEGLPEYLFDFLEEFKTKEEQLRHFSKVLLTFFKAMEKKYKGFLRRYFRFEREWRVIMAGYRAKKLRVDPAIELQYEDLADPLVAQVLAQKDVPFFEFPFEYHALGEKLKDVGKNPLDQYMLMASFRFERIGEEIQDHPFSLNYFLGYFVQLMIVEDLRALDENRGNERLNEIVKGSL